MYVYITYQQRLTFNYDYWKKVIKFQERPIRLPAIQDTYTITCFPAEMKLFVHSTTGSSWAQVSKQSPWLQLKYTCTIKLTKVPWYSWQRIYRSRQSRVLWPAWAVQREIAFSSQASIYDVGFSPASLPCTYHWKTHPIRIICWWYRSSHTLSSNIKRHLTEQN